MATLPANPDFAGLGGAASMDWTASAWWWVAAAALVAAELASGTFYLLMLALGAMAAALAAHAGLGHSGQLLVAAAVGGGAVALWHLQRSKQPRPAAAASNRDVNLDIGGTVQVAHWHADGTARVQYRGAGWDVRFAGSGTPPTGDFVIQAVDGNCLLIDRR